MIIHPLIQQGMKKYIVLGTQSVKIGPFLVMLSPKTIPLPIGIDRVCDFLTLNTIMRHFVYFYMIKHPLDQSGMKKYMELGTQNVKIGPFSAILGPQTWKLRFIIYRDCRFWLQSGMRS